MDYESTDLEKTLALKIMEKDKEIKRLNNIINEAIEYIKAVGVIPKNIDIFVLLDILKGSDKEW